MLCRLGHYGTVNFIDFCPGIFHAPGPLPRRPWMRAAEITVFPFINRRHFQIVIMDICQYLLMRPIRHRAVSCCPLSVGVKVISPADIIPIGSPPPKKQHVQLLLLVIFRLPPVLDKTTLPQICCPAGKASADGKTTISYPGLC